MTQPSSKVIPQPAPKLAVQPTPGPPPLFRTFFSFLRWMIPVWHHAVLALLCLIIVSTLSIIGPWLSKFLIDDAFPNQDWDLLYGIFFALISLALINRFLNTASTILNAYIDVRVSLALKTHFYRHLQRLSLTFHENRPVGEHMYRANADIDAVMRMTTDILPATIRSVYEFFLILAFTAWLDWSVTVVILIYAFPYAIIAQKIATVQRRLDRRTRERWQARDAGLQEGVAGVAVVQTFGRRRHEVRRYMHLTVAGYRAAMRQFYMSLIEQQVTGGGGFLPWVKNQLIRIYFFRSVIIGDLTYGSVFPIFSYMNRLTNPVQQLINYFQQLRVSMVPAERIMETLGVPPAVTDRPGAGSMPPINGEVTFEDVHFAYEDGTPVLNGVSFSVHSGQKVGIVGHSGSGKSTVVNLILRLYDPSAGRILVDGIDLRDVRLDSYQGQIGLVFQETHLLNGTIKENLLFGKPRATDEEIQTAIHLSDLEGFVASQQNGSDSDLGEGVRLSMGQKQQIGIARALIRNPAILILDEPTSSLDTATEQRFFQTLQRAMEGRTTFIVSHRISTVVDADVILVMSEGRIVERGKHADLLKQRGVYYNLYNLYFGLKSEVVIPNSVTDKPSDSSATSP